MSLVVYSVSILWTADQTLEPVDISNSPVIDNKVEPSPDVQAVILLSNSPFGVRYTYSVPASEL